MRKRSRHCLASVEVSTGFRTLAIIDWKFLGTTIHLAYGDIEPYTRLVRLIYDLNASVLCARIMRSKSSRFKWPITCSCFFFFGYFFYFIFIFICFFFYIQVRLYVSWKITSLSFLFKFQWWLMENDCQNKGYSINALSPHQSIIRKTQISALHIPLSRNAIGNDLAKSIAHGVFAS